MLLIPIKAVGRPFAAGGKGRSSVHPSGIVLREEALVITPAVM